MTLLERVRGWRRRGEPRPLRRIVGWNIYVGRSPVGAVAALRRVIRDTRADLVALQECERHVRLIRLAFGARWRVLAPAGWSESANCPVMVRRTVLPGRRRAIGWGWIRNHVGWVGPKHGKRHPGRTWSWVLVGGTYVVSLHRVTGGPSGRNRAAYAEEARALKSFLAEHRGKVVIIGDANGSAGDRSPGSMRDIARGAGARLVVDPDRSGIDYALARGFPAAELERLRDKYGSDHAPVVLTLEPAAA